MRKQYEDCECNIRSISDNLSQIGIQLINYDMLLIHYQ